MGSDPRTVLGTLHENAPPRGSPTSSGRTVLSILGPDRGYIAEPDYGLVFASEDLLAHEILSYAWLKWNREFETPAWARDTIGQVTTARALINTLLVQTIWGRRRPGETPDIPLWQPGNIWNHPSIVNSLARQVHGGPEGIVWEQVNQGPAESVTEYMNNELSIR